MTCMGAAGPASACSVSDMFVNRSIHVLQYFACLRWPSNFACEVSLAFFSAFVA